MNSEIAIFISHSTTDETAAEALAHLFSKALSLRPEKIRCTSALPYSLPYGARTNETLRREVAGAGVVIGLITPSSTASHWVLFELGARWGQDKPLFSVLAGGAGSEFLPDPIRDRHALVKITPPAVVKFVEEVASTLRITPLESWRYDDLVQSFVTASQAVTRNTAGKPQAGSEYEEESFEYRRLEWTLTPQFFRSYRSVTLSAIGSPAYLDTLILGPFCRKCKRDAHESIRKGNVCLFCPTEYDLWKEGHPTYKETGTLLDEIMHDQKMEVYREAQSAAKLGKLKQH